MFMLSRFCHSVCLSVHHFDPNYFKIGGTERAEILFLTSMQKNFNLIVFWGAGPLEGPLGALSIQPKASKMGQLVAIWQPWGKAFI
jgi:hypothetical protein